MSVNLRSYFVRTSLAFRNMRHAVAELIAFDPDKAFIEAATDIYDLENRMRIVDRNQSTMSSPRWMTGHM